MNKFENMHEFFDKRSETYDIHMKENLVSFDRFYSCTSSCISNTRDKVRILDIGCGTGLELEGIFKIAPNADIVGVDISGEMLDKLRVKYGKYLNRITLLRQSYLSLPLGEEIYDYVIAVMTLHHLLPDEKLKLYRKIKKALKPDGKYIEGDYVVTPEKEKQLLDIYYESCRSVEDIRDGTYHIDIPFSLDTQKRILAEAGFAGVEVLLQEGEAAVYVATI